MNDTNTKSKKKIKPITLKDFHLTRDISEHQIKVITTLLKEKLNSSVQIEITCWGPSITNEHTINYRIYAAKGQKVLDSSNPWANFGPVAKSWKKLQEQVKILLDGGTLNMLDYRD